ncbi:MAG: sodium:solute symporter [Rikenellaceae bacterium]
MTPLAVAITLGLYILILLSAAYYSSRKARNADYFIAGRSLQWQMAAMAMVAAAMSGITFVSVPGSVAADSFSYMQMTLGFTVGQFVIAFVLIPIFYKHKVVSLYEYLEGRFGSVSHKSGAWFFFVSKVTIAALRLYIMCVALQILLYDHYNIPFFVNALVSVGVIWLATRRGGVKSLIWTDTLKTLCLVGSLILSILYITQGLDWSFLQMVDQVSQNPHSQIFFFDDPSSPKYFWKMFLAGVFTLIAMTGLDQDMMQCNLSCVDYRHAQKNIVVTALCQMVVIMLFLVLGVLLYEYAAAYSLDIPEKSDQLFSFIAVESGLPMIVGVLFILGLTASTFASSASSLTALTTSCTVDLLGGAKSRTEVELTGVRHTVHLALAVIITLLVLVVGEFSDQSVINVLFKFVGYTYGPILGMFTFGMVTKWRVHDRWVWLVAVISLIISVVGEQVVLQQFGYRIGFELLIYNAMITFVGMMLLIKRGE